MLAFFTACNSSQAPVDAEVQVAAPTAPVEAPLPADLAVGVGEVRTPPELLRATQRVDRVPPRHLELRVDFAGGDFASVRAELERWGFTVEDGDGASLRLLAPDGDRWSERLEPLPSVARVNETLTQDKLDDGSVRAGSATFGDVGYTWALKDGVLVESMTGAPLPARPDLPRTVPVAVVRCLAPIRTAMLDGETAGPGWERALLKEPSGWAVVVDHFGACDATGWFVARRDAKSDNLTIGGKTVKELDDATLFASATKYLTTERAQSDEGAAAAVDILRRGDDTQLAAAIDAIAPGSQQERLLLALADRDEAAAVALAARSTSPTARGWAAGIDATARLSVLADPGATADSLLLAMSAWRPGSTEAPTVARLKEHKDVRVRMRATDLALDAAQPACIARAPSARSATLEQAKTLYRECPQQPVRLQAFSRLVQLDRGVATELVSATLRAPESVRIGINAVRAANALERDDLLEQAVADMTLDRDVRAEALRTLQRGGRSANVLGLAEKHGAFLGVRPGEAPAMVDGGAKKGRRKR
ncbi:MAG: hypothetical protein EXR71_00950 [Myxococcales bacterium]|nr:hypothetical protein [Myxococcales bacterium]